MKSTSNPQSCRKKEREREKILEKGTFIFCSEISRTRRLRECRCASFQRGNACRFSSWKKNRSTEAWGPVQLQEKNSRSQRAILGALGEFRGILGLALGIRNAILGIRNSILGMASHDLSNAKSKILGAAPGAIPGTD